MALIKTSMFSQSLNRFTEFYVLMPQDAPSMFTQGNPHFGRAPKTLILLHGFSGINTDWLLGGNAQGLSTQYNLCVVLPSGENSFYLDNNATGQAYATFTGKELVEFLRSIFHIAMTREDTMIGGYSMGGFGALHTGFQFPGNFSKVIALSSALIQHEVAIMTPDYSTGMANYDYYVRTFGSPETVLESPANPEYLAKKCLAEGIALPDVFMACGSEDFLIERNRAFRDFLKAEGIPHVYRETPGIHNWEFWNASMGPALEWALRD